MNDKMRREFSAERPVSSEFGQPEGGFLLRRIMTVCVLLALLGGGVYLVAQWARQETSAPQNLPTIKAEIPFKEKPADPGGIEIQHQNVLVFQKLDGVENKTGDQQVEHLLPSPAQPAVSDMRSGNANFSGQPQVQSSTDETAGDVALSEPQNATSTPLENLSESSSGRSEDVVVKSATQQEKDHQPSKVEHLSRSAEAQVKTTVAEGAAKPAVQTAPTTAPVVASKVVPEQKPASLKAENVAKPVVPQSLPESLFLTGEVPQQTKSEKAALAQAQADNAAGKVLPAGQAPAAGSVKGPKAMVQLGSVAGKEAGESLLKNLQNKYVDTLAGHSLRLNRADLGAKGIYYRVQSQPMAEADAKEICARLKSRNAACILVRS